MPTKQTKPKKLTQPEIVALADKWAGFQTRIEKLEAAKAAELAPVLERHARELEPIEAKHDALIEPVQEKADAIEMQVIEWLDGLKSSKKLNGKKAVAERIVSSKFGDRVVNAEKFVAKCIERKLKDFWRLVSVTIKNAESVMGKDDMAEITAKPTVPIETSTLTLKD